MKDDEDWLDDRPSVDGRASGDDWVASDDRESSDDLPSRPVEERERAIRELCWRLGAAMPPMAPAPAAASRDGQHGAPGAPFPRPRSVPPKAQGWATLRSPVLGAAPSAANDVAQPPAPPVPMPAVVQQPAFLVSTALPIDLPPEAWAKRGALPFKPAPPEQSQPKRAPKTTQSRVHGLEPGGTLFLGEKMAKPTAAVLPFLAPAPVPAPAPPLTLRQYASMCAELARSPERSGEILRRYQVHSDEALTALQAYWAFEHAARPEVRTAFEQDFASRTAWLRAHGT